MYELMYTGEQRWSVWVMLGARDRAVARVWAHDRREAMDTAERLWRHAPSAVALSAVADAGK